YQFTGGFFGVAPFSPGTFTSGTGVSLIPGYLDTGAGSVPSSVAPANNYNYDPLASYFSESIRDFFNYYLPQADGGGRGSLQIDHRGPVTTKWTGVVDNKSIHSSNGQPYTVLKLTGEAGQYGNTYAGDTIYVYQPFFSSNTNQDIPGVNV